ncbi:MAG TPA: hypothetical protein VGI10_19210 [Polyangiaceae bacterium]
MQQPLQFVEVERLVEHGQDAEPLSATVCRLVAERRHENHRHASRYPAQLSQDIDGIQTGHAHVGDDCLEAVHIPAELLGDAIEELAPRRRDAHLIAMLAKERRQERAKRRVVFRQ